MTDTILICAVYDGDLFFPDNKLGHCAECGCRVQYRPHADFDYLRCASCAVMMMKDGDEIALTVRMLDDVRDYFRKMRKLS